MNETLFPLPPVEALAEAERPQGRPRLKRANRLQIELRPSDLESLLPEDHPARWVWDMVDQLDLSPLYEGIRAVEGQPGQNAIDPKILMALWLYATLEGVGSARALDRLCAEHDAYRWLRGGVTVNYHTLADFRVRHAEYLDAQLTRSVAALMAEGLVTLQRTAQDGKRLRAHAGSGSFHRRETLERCLQEAEEQVQDLRREVDADPAGCSRRQRAARERARRERAARVRRALEQVGELEKRQAKSHKKGAREKAVRASTTDPEVRIMKMPDGGLRPAYNLQVVTDTQSRVIVGMDVVNTPDQGQMAPMLEQVRQRYGRAPAEHLADGGFATLQDIQSVSPPQGETVVYAPVAASRPVTKPSHGKQPTPAPGVVAWRERMETVEAKAIYKERAATAEWINALIHNRGLEQLRVRGLRKVKAVLLWFALLHNLLRGRALRLAAASRAT